MIQGFEKLFDGSGDNEILWRGTFLAALPNAYSHLRTTLASKKNCKLDEYFELALQEHRLQKGTDKTGNHLMVGNLNKTNKKVNQYHNNGKYYNKNNSDKQSDKTRKYNNHYQSKNQTNDSSRKSNDYKNQKKANYQKDKTCLFCGGNHLIKDCDAATEAKK